MVVKVWETWPWSTRLVVAGIAVLAVLGLSVSCEIARSSGAAGPTIGQEPEIRVRLRSGDDSIGILAGPEGARMRDIAGTGAWVRVLPGEVVVRREAGGVEVVEGGEVVQRSLAGFRLKSGDDDVVIDGVRLRGEAAFVLAKGGGLDVIATLPMERYLGGVLEGELVRGWPLAAFQAQAVVARSYAAHERARARDKGRAFDVESTTLDQVFVGTSEDPVIAEAIETTRGMVLVDATVPASGVLRAYYSSTCGGRAASAAGVWPSTGDLAFNAAIPLQGSLSPCPCGDSSLYRWERERGVWEARARIRAWGRVAGHRVATLGRIASLEVSERNGVGRPNVFDIRDNAGEVFRLTAEELRVALNTRARGHADVNRETRLPSGDFEALVRGEAITLRGRGFGHGVGMCQWGARGHALRGRPWREIVLSYYPGAALSRVW